MPIRNPFEDYDFGEGYAPRRQRKNYFSGSPQDPVAARTRDMLEQGGVYEGPSYSAQSPEPAQPESMWGNWMRELQDAYTKEGPAAGAYREHLNTMPQYTTPSKWQKFGAALTGASEGLRAGGAAGWNAGQEAAQAPYKRELQQWGLKEKGLAQQMGIEEKMSGRRIEFMNQARQMAKDERELSKWMKDYDLKVKQESNDEAYRKATVDRWGRQDKQIFTDNQGNVYEYDPGDFANRRLLGPGEAAERIRHSKVMEGQGERGLGISGYNAQTSRMNYGVNQQQADLAGVREDRISQTPMDPRAQSSAMASAYERAASSNPKWSQFFVEGMPDPPEVSSPNDPLWKEYQKFRAEAARISEGILSKPRFGTTIQY